MQPATRSERFRVAHGAILLLSFPAALTVLGPSSWPLFWLAPLALYLLIVLAIPALRIADARPLLGETRRSVILATAVVAVGAAIALLLFQSLAKPDLTEFLKLFPDGFYGSFLLFAVLFSLLNAALEEYVFRGVLYDAVSAEYGRWIAVFATGLLFGLGHAWGYPPGVVGIILASVYGIVQGLLRLQSGGLLWPWISHVVADATIMVIVPLYA